MNSEKSIAAPKLTMQKPKTSQSSILKELRKEKVNKEPKKLLVPKRLQSEKGL